MPCLGSIGHSIKSKNEPEMFCELPFPILFVLRFYFILLVCCTFYVTRTLFFFLENLIVEFCDTIVGIGNSYLDKVSHI